MSSTSSQAIFRNRSLVPYAAESVKTQTGNNGVCALLDR